MSSQWYFLNIRDEENAAAFLREKGSVQEKERGLKKEHLGTPSPTAVQFTYITASYCYIAPANITLLNQQVHAITDQRQSTSSLYHPSPGTAANGIRRLEELIRLCDSVRLKPKLFP
ncbi:hypothetical protein M513_07268 [Trichuris suis]|uniref:Uncharacterized protein n=1 Tax=Trichuris suis TaxID=68888 RepID=A0A085M3Z3_9BILA|nr:hypothetical protein M513_07268 [Trichuris suis]